MKEKQFPKPQQLKLISLKIVKDPFRKNLIGNGPYVFYTLSQGNSKKSSILDVNFFKLSSDTIKPLISICAIAGKNGSGKSTIVDSLLRLINNFSYKCLEKFGKEDLSVAGKYQNVELCFSIGQKVFYLKQNGRGIDAVNLYDGSGKEIKTDTEDYETIKKIFQNYFFYSIIMNYSMYAFNTDDYNEEWYLRKGKSYPTHWLNGIFHKNDGYKTPIVLNPWRDAGKININLENQLAKDRLVSLFICEKNKKNKVFNEINDKNIVEELKIKLLSEKYLLDSLRQTLNEDRVGKIKKTKLYETFLSEKIKRKFDKDISAGMSAYKNEKQIRNNIHTEFFKACSSPLSPISEEQLKKLIGIVTREKKLKHINFISGQLLSYQQAFLKTKKLIIEIWQEIYDFRISATAANLVAADYLAYKTLSVIWSYSNDVFNFSEKDLNVIRDRSSAPNRKILKEFIIKLNGDTSHITLKIRQVLAFFKLKHYSVNDKGLSLDKFSENVEEKKGIKDKYGWEYIDLVPAHCFETDIILGNKDGQSEKKYKFSKISSGERQLVYSISSILYHIRNINSISNEDKRIKYKHVNLILDEIELYFHPEFQRQFVYRLLDAIYKMNFTEIESINIMISTHSPFILSDIPKNNILYLDDGNIASSEKFINPFAANISDILAQSFFLENGFLGEFAANKIKQVIGKVKEKQKKGQKLSKSEYDAFNDFISLIGEPLLKNRLQAMINELYDNKEDIIKEEIVALLETLSVKYKDFLKMKKTNMER